MLQIHIKYLQYFNKNSLINFRRHLKEPCKIKSDKKNTTFHIVINLPTISNRYILFLKIPIRESAVDSIPTYIALAISECKVYINSRKIGIKKLLDVFLSRVS